ncbi:hypothetical protein Q8A67_021956 [Cirrhinus molitorella]|uniref:Uncharacterized protein n=2 Tax=Cirrhinus molitorella TaxID=172907 RepID=A0AA88P6Q2_9TELE|nr:hypothetical protein Q8A67_021956 [Cirrhinus molitorella]
MAERRTSHQFTRQHSIVQNSEASDWLRGERSELQLKHSDQQESASVMTTYMDMSFQSSIKTQHVQHARCVLTCLERKCGYSLEKLKCALGEYLQNGIHTSDLLERAVSFITLKRVLLSHDGYSRYSRDILRLFPDHTEDVAALCSEE